jgi:uncharacterized membrane protein YvlD (DUF360 family)
MSHLIPLYILRHGPFDLVQNILTFFIYLIFLEENSLDLKKVYGSVLADPPLTVRDYLKNRVLSSPGHL